MKFLGAFEVKALYIMKNRVAQISSKYKVKTSKKMKGPVPSPEKEKIIETRSSPHELINGVIQFSLKKIDRFINERLEEMKKQAQFSMWQAFCNS